MNSVGAPMRPKCRPWEKTAKRLLFAETHRVVLHLLRIGTLFQTFKIQNSVLLKPLKSRIHELFGITHAMILYYPFYQYLRLTEMPYEAWWHWCLAALAMDFGYYWAHRGVHELNIGWERVFNSSYNSTNNEFQKFSFRTVLYFIPYFLC